MTVSLVKLLDVQLDFVNAVFESSDLNWNQRKRTKKCTKHFAFMLEEMFCFVLVVIGMKLCGDRQVFLKLVAA